MQEILMMMQSTCPYCKQAFGFLDELTRENPAYAKLTVRRVDERVERALAESLDYWYVPTFFVGGKKLHEGACKKDDVRAVLDAALA